MAQRRSIFADDYDKLVKRGFGQGRYDRYKPLIEVKDAASYACKYRIYIQKFNRSFHLLSDGEFCMILMLEWDDNIAEVREQFALRPDLTQDLAQKLNIRHPAVRGRDIIMTTDFLVTYRRPLNGFEYKAIQVKNKLDELTSRTWEKLRLECSYWERQGIAWSLELKERFNKILCDNLKVLNQMRNACIDRKILLKLADMADPLLKSGLAFRECSRHYAYEIPDMGTMPAAEVVKLLTGKKLWRFKGLESSSIFDSRLSDFAREAMP